MLTAAADETEAQARNMSDLHVRYMSTCGVEIKIIDI